VSDRSLLLLRASAPLREIKKRRHRPASFLQQEKKKRITELACLGGVMLLRQVFSSVVDANEIDFVFYQNLDRDPNSSQTPTLVAYPLSTLIFLLKL